MNIMIMPKIAKHSNECEREENSEASNVYCINDKNCEDELINGIGESKGEEQKCEEPSACQDNLSYHAKNDEELRINSVVEKNNEEEKRESSYTCQENTETGAKVYINGVAEANNEEKKCEEKCEKSIKVGLNANQVQSNSEANMAVLPNDVRNSAAIIGRNGDNKQLTLAVNLRDDENAASEEYTSLNIHGQPNQLFTCELIKDSRQENKSADAQMRSSDYITLTQEEYYSEFTSGNRLHDIIRLPSMINTEVILKIHNIVTFKRC